MQHFSFFNMLCHLVRKRTLDHVAKLASLAKWLSVRLVTNWLWVGILLLSLKLQISHPPVLSKLFLDIQANVECRFPLKLVRDITTYSHFVSTPIY